MRQLPFITRISAHHFSTWPRHAAWLEFRPGTVAGSAPLILFNFFGCVEIFATACANFSLVGEFPQLSF